jgi:GcrA cell cycle regulator
MAEHTSNWTVERVDALRRLWRDGISASEIASRIGGTSRNAVIGKVTRLGLPGRKVSVRKIYDRFNIKDSRAERRTSEPPRVQPKVARNWRSEPLPETQASDIARVSFIDLENHHCRFIPGDPRNIKQNEPQFCGCEVVRGMPYCSTHAHRVFAPVGVRKKAPHNQHYSPMLPSSRVHGTAAANASEFPTETA